MKFFKQLITIAAAVLLSACASIVSKSEYPVTINSEPSSASITITDEDGKEVFAGETPSTVTLSTKKGYFKGKDYTVNFKKEGFPDQSTAITRTTDGWYIGGNIILGGLIGWLIVDPNTGAMWKLDESVYMNLETGSSETPAETAKESAEDSSSDEVESNEEDNSTEQEETEDATTDSNSTELKVVMLSDVPESLHDHLVRIQ